MTTVRRAVQVVLILELAQFLGAFPAAAQPWRRRAVSPPDLPSGTVPAVPIPLKTFCDEWGFEDQTFNQWTCLTGPYGQANAVVACGTNNMQQLVSSGSDMFGLAQVGGDGGTGAIRIGDLKNGGSTSAIQRTFTVTADTAILNYRYAMMVDDGGKHDPTQQPYFRARVTVGPNTVYDFTRVSNATDTFFTPAQGSLFMRRWSCGVINLQPYVGQVATIRFEASDCRPGGHLGYAYVDFPCNPNDVSLAIAAKTCVGAPLMADGAANSGVVDHWWSVELSDANVGRNPAEEVGEWFSGPADVPFDIAAFAASHGKPMTCGKYYRVKLAIKTECQLWLDTVKLVYVACKPTISAGPDRTICASAPVPVAMGSGAFDPTVTYAWTANGALVGNSSLLIVNPATTTTFTLTATDSATGCVATSHATVQVLPNVKPVISICYCPPMTTLTATLPGYAGPRPAFQWSTGSTNASISVQPSATTTYSVAVTTPCDTNSTSIVLDEVPKLSLIAPNTLVPTSTNPLVNHFWIVHLGMGAHQKPAYEARGYEFTVFDRFGGEIFRKSEALDTCDAYGNVEIPGWDGRSNNGSSLPVGVYTYRLRILSCQEKWTTVKVNGEVAPEINILK